ncbi:hypothetical protein FOA43_004027 [Brettanomyces nanus]|uniref:Uncharacterized protein n=1 Tax=Eeniella nana TaxID=13502 RepID=A0A875S8Y1_EENNA|nr:uncharacterized protein FOA43_004027 [Brettanomyces nanus]QPG76635.1 hypothetical protein FOA43_004027 [Brettanomyces nanus]
MLRDISNDVAVSRSLNNKRTQQGKGFTKNVRYGNVQRHQDENGVNMRLKTSQQKEDVSSCPKTIQPRPIYSFPELFRNVTEKMFPFIERLHRHGFSRETSKDQTINLMAEVAFQKNPIRKYCKVLNESYGNKELQSVIKDPCEGIFQEMKNHDKTLKCYQSKLRVEGSGYLQVMKQPVYDITIGSKRSLDDISLKSNFKTPIKKNHIHRIHGHLSERLDNSMTISAKAILKMVDDSLVSSDTSLYSQSLVSIGQMRGKEDVNINEDDLKNVLDDERVNQNM